MGYLTLLIAVVIGGVIGYLLKQFWGGRVIEQIEKMWSDKVRTLTKDLDAARAEAKEQEAGTLEAERAEAECREQLKAAQTELIAERDKGTSVRTALAGRVSAIGTLEAAAKESKAKVETAERKAVDLEAAVQSKVASIEDLEGKLAASEKVAIDKDSVIETLEKQLAELTPLKEKLSTAMGAVAAWEARYKSLDTSKKVESAALKTRIGELEPLTAKLRDWEFRYNGMLNEKDSALAKMTSTLSALEPLKRRLELSTKESERLSARVKELEVEIAAVASEKDLIINSLRARTGDVDPLERKLHAAGEENQSLHFRIGQLEDSLKLAAATKVEHNALVTNLRARIADVEPLERKLHEAVQERDQSQGRIVQLEDALLHSSNDTLVTSLRARSADVQPLERKLHAAHEELELLQARLQNWDLRFNSAVHEKDAEIERLRTQLTAPAAKPKDDRDDLKKLRGVGPSLEKQLNAYGVLWFKQIALWAKPDIVAFERQFPKLQNRVERDQWIASAKEEHFKKYGEAL